MGASQVVGQSGGGGAVRWWWVYTFKYIPLSDPKFGLLYSSCFLQDHPDSNVELLVCPSLPEHRYALNTAEIQKTFHFYHKTRRNNFKKVISFWVSCDAMNFSRVNSKLRHSHRSELKVYCMCWPNVFGSKYV